MNEERKKELECNVGIDHLLELILYRVLTTFHQPGQVFLIILNSFQESLCFIQTLEFIKFESYIVIWSQLYFLGTYSGYMQWPVMDGFCSNNSWSVSNSWNDASFVFDSCFEDTIFTILPCIVFWLLGLLEIPVIITKKKSAVIQYKLTVAKMVTCACLLILSLIGLIFTGIQNDLSVITMDFLAQSILVATYILSICLLWAEMKRNMGATWSQFFFWSFLAFAEIMKCISLSIHKESKLIEIGAIMYIIKLIHVPFVTISFLLMCTSDNCVIWLMSTKNYKGSHLSDKLSSIPGKLLYIWISPLFSKIFYENVKVEDLWNLEIDFKSGSLGDKIEKGMKSIGSNGRCNILKILLRRYSWEFLVSIILSIVGELSRYLSIYLQGSFIYSLTNQEPKWHGYFFAVTLTIANLFSITLYNYCVNLQQMLSMKITSGLMSAIFRKAMRLSNESRKTVAIGEITNLMSVDTQRFIDASLCTCRFYGAPIVVVVGILFIWKDFGIASLVIFFIWMLFFAFNVYFTFSEKNHFKKTAELKDGRIKFLNEILRGIKSVKVNAWEMWFQSQVERLRNEELKSVMRSFWIYIATYSSFHLIKYFALLALFEVYFLINPDGFITADATFPTIGVIMIFQLTIHDTALYLSNAVQLQLAIKRIDKFVNRDEVEKTAQSSNLSESSETVILIENGYFKWTKSSSATLRSINLKIHRNMLVTLAGHVGSGKSSMLFAIMGEMITEKGSKMAQGPFGYVPQLGWLQNSTVKDNILFGKPYDDHYYKLVIEACGLLYDFETFPLRDDTEIGERGITLSGGQILRMSLARAVYSRANIYLLDDPLSALDSSVGKYVFHSTIGPQGLLASSVRIFSTHIPTYFSLSDKIVVLNDGEIIFQGTYPEIASQKPSILSSSGLPLAHQEMPDAFTAKAHIPEIATESGVPKLMTPEEPSTNYVFSAALYYLKSMNAYSIVVIIACNLITICISVAAEIWLSHWTSERPSTPELNVKQRNYRMKVYAAFALVYTLFSSMSDTALHYGHHVARKALHIKMLDNLFRLPMSFFETTPKGRILNRFSRDVDVLDLSFPKITNACLLMTNRVLISLIILTIYLPWVLLGLLVLLAFFIIAQRVYARVSQKLSRLEAITRSPVFALFIEALAGCETIRAFQRQQDFYNALDGHVDDNRRCYIPLLVSGTWLLSHSIVLSSFLVLLTGILCTVFSTSLNSGLIGLLITSAIFLSNPCGYLAFCFTKLEIDLTSIERIKEYSELRREAEWNIDGSHLPTDWPSGGEILFRDYSTRYRKDLEVSLRHVTCRVKSGEKVGIVGRTGAGKSTLAMALFRIIEADEGAIHIDGIDISTIGLHDLRSRVTLIPQEPVLFSGSIRFNLDPMNKHSDDELYEALESSNLKAFVKNLKTGLDYELSEGCGNLSAGQRQLMCLARAILRKTKIVVLDEATASVDLETDDIVQRVIRGKFSSCTLLVIAHRISTIIDSDRVMVIKDKSIVEFDSPVTLMNDPSSEFYKIAQDVIRTSDKF